MLESYDRINFLDLTIIRKTPKLDIDVFPKTTTTDTTIHYLSNHQIEHKLAAYRYYIERMFNLPLNKTNNTVNGKPSSTLQKTTNSQPPSFKN